VVLSDGGVPTATGNADPSAAKRPGFPIANCRVAISPTERAHEPQTASATMNALSSTLKRYAPPSFSRRSSVSAMANSGKPQSKQTASFGHTKSAGLFTLFSPGKWMFISELNSVWFSDPHDLHAIIAFPGLQNRLIFAIPR
jgi:hypothetical protein